MLSLNYLLILAITFLTCAQNILSTTTSQVTSTELICNTIITDKSIETPLHTITISTRIETEPPVFATSINTPVFTLTPSTLFETSTVIETIISTVTNKAAPDIFSTTLVEFTTTTALIPVRATTTEISTLIVQETTTTTSIVPTSRGFLPIGATFLNQGVYANSSPPDTPPYQPIVERRDLLPRGNITIITSNDETIFDESDCIVLPIATYFLRLLNVYPHEDVYIEAATALTGTLSAITTTVLSTVTVIATSTVTPINAPTTLSFTSTSIITETTQTTYFDTEISTSTSIFVHTKTSSVFAACATNGGNYLGPGSFPPKNQYLVNMGPPEKIINNTRIVENITTAVNCCVLCQTDSTCAVSLFDPKHLWCGILWTNNNQVGVANQSLNPFTIMLTANVRERDTTTFVAMNGNYGYFSGIDDWS